MRGPGGPLSLRLLNIKSKTSMHTVPSVMSAAAASRRGAPRARKAVMELTDAAAKRIQDLLSRKNDPDIVGIKVGLRKRGCNGLAYTLDYTKEVDRFDEVVKDKGVTVVVDGGSLMNLLGTRMDFVSDKLKSEFTFTNPNAKGSCGCGESFNV